MQHPTIRSAYASQVARFGSVLSTGVPLLDVDPPELLLVVLLAPPLLDVLEPEDEEEDDDEELLDDESPSDEHAASPRPRPRPRQRPSTTSMDRIGRMIRP